jgi:glutamyl endopeptidase
MITGEVSIVDADDFATTSVSYPSNMPPQMTPNEVIGSDSRTEVTNTTLHPYPAIFLLHIPAYGSHDPERGTATAFASNAIITAAHVVLDGNLNPFLRTYNLYTEFYGTGYDTVYTDVDIEFIFVPAAYYVNQTPANYANDYAIIKLADEEEVYFQNIMGFSQNCNVGNTVTITGYPAAGSTPPSGAAEMGLWTSSGQITATTANSLRYQIDTSPGQSGAPVYNSSNQILGVHSGSYTVSGVVHNFACRVDAPMYNMMSAIRDGDL